MSTDPTQIEQTPTTGDASSTPDASQPTSPAAEPTPATEQAPAPEEAAPVNTGPARKVGDMVLYVLPEGTSPGEVRPAVVVRTWSDDPGNLVNLQVFTDGVNDFITAHPGASGILWRTSVHNDEVDKAPGTYHSLA